MKDEKDKVVRPEKKRSGLFSSLFGKKETKNIFEEELIQSPWRTVARTFRGNIISMIALFVFIIIAGFSFIYPLISPVDPSFEEVTQQNIAPGMKMMDIPKLNDSKFIDISGGVSFGAGVDDKGKIHFWGDTKVISYDMANIPKASKDAKFKTVSIGIDHVAATDIDGKVHSWGNNRQQQSKVPGNARSQKDVKQVLAAKQATIVVNKKGETIFYGNADGLNFFEYHEYQGRVEKVTANSDVVVALLDDGSIAYLGIRENAYSKVPEGNDFVQIEAIAKAFAALKENGEVVFWGNISYRNEADIPEHNSKIIKLAAGRRHFVALLENGEVIAWGDNIYKQSNVPKFNEKIVDIFVDSYQNYAVTESGEIKTWGLKGYFMGTDEYGRDLFHRLLNGGQKTITIGAVAVMISTIIGITVGGFSGYFGGKVDLFLQRLSEVVASLPFLPFAMILNSLIGNKMTSEQRIYLMMIILGILSWTGLQRLVRAQVLSVREQEFVVAAKSIGIKETSIVFKHIIPNVVSVIIVATTLSFARSMLTEATLSFLGFGVLPPTPTWGNMLYGANNSVVIQTYWWRWIFPGIALSLCVIAVNLVGDGLRDAIDPKSQER